MFPYVTLNDLCGQTPSYEKSCNNGKMDFFVICKRTFVLNNKWCIIDGCIFVIIYHVGLAFRIMFTQIFEIILLSHTDKDFAVHLVLHPHGIAHTFLKLDSWSPGAFFPFYIH